MLDLLYFAACIMLVYVYQTAVKVLFDITVSHVAWLSHEDLNAVQDLQ